MNDEGEILRLHDQWIELEKSGIEANGPDQSSPWMPWCHLDDSIDDARSWIHTTIERSRNEPLYDCAVLSRGEFAGGGGINHINAMDRVANLRYWIRASSTSLMLLTPHGLGSLAESMQTLLNEAMELG